MNKLKIFFTTLLFTAISSVPCWAQSYERMSEYEANLFAEKAYVNGEYEVMKAVRAFWVRECNKLKNRNCDFALCGNAEGVMRVRIPTRLLFQSNDTTLINSAESILRPFVKYLLGDNALASCIIACSSDNNGSEKYLNKLTTSRAANISRWFAAQGITPESLSYFGLGSKVARVQNDNIKNRELNRRVCIYFVPSKQMIKLAKKNKLLD